VQKCGRSDFQGYFSPQAARRLKAFHVHAQKISRLEEFGDIELGCALGYSNLLIVEHYRRTAIETRKNQPDPLKIIDATGVAETAEETQAAAKVIEAEIAQPGRHRYAERRR
jgi:hypothetical protein